MKLDRSFPLFRGLIVALFLVTFTAPAFSQDSSPTFAADLQELSDYSLGKPDAMMRRIAESVRLAAAAGPAQAAVLADYEKGLVGLLETECSPEARRFICRLLGDAGTAGCVPALAGLLGKPDTFQMALTALEKMPLPEASSALSAALPGLEGDARLAVLAAMGRQKLAESLGTLTGVIESGAPDGEIAVAARALADLGSPEACQALARAAAAAPADKQALYADPCLTCSDTLAASGDFSALELFRAPAMPAHIRLAAMAALIKNQPDRAQDLLLEALKDSDDNVASKALMLARTINTEAVTEALVGLLGTVSDERKPALLGILGDRGDVKALDAVKALADNPLPEVRRAALKATGALGDASLVPFFLERSVSGEIEEQRIAKDVLARMADKNTNKKLLDVSMGNGDEKMRVCAVSLLAERRVLESAQELCKLAYESPAAVRNEAVRSLRVLGSADMLGQMLFITLVPDLKSVRDVLPQTIAEIALRGTQPGGPQAGKDGALEVIRFLKDMKEQGQVSGLPEQQAQEASCIVLDALGQIGSNAAFDTARAALDDANTEIRKSALGAVAKFQRLDALDSLKHRIDTEEEPALRSQAYSAYLGLLKSASVLPGKVVDTHLQYAFDQARTTPERREFLATATKTPSLPALLLIESLLGSEEVKADAMRAAMQVATAICGAWPEEAAARLQYVADNAPAPSLAEEAKKSLDFMGHFRNYIVAWEYAGPYFEVGVMATSLFERDFPPISTPDTANWKTLPLMVDSAMPHALELDRVIGGEERVAFVRTTIQSETDQAAVLELGTNDGCKVWFNGEQIFYLNEGRALTPGQDKLPVQLRAGKNSLMIAVFQQGGAWRATVRLVNAEGKPLSGVKAGLE